MKIFGIQITKDKSETLVPVVKDILPTEETPIETKAIAEIKRVQNPVLIYSQHGGAIIPGKKRTIFEPAEYDLYEISRVEDVDSYVRQAFKKKVGLFLKEGYDYVGPDKKVVKYLKTRFAQIERATNIPHSELLRRLASQFIRKSNAFLVKVRKESASGGKVRKDANGKTLKPIAGYFPVQPETMQILTDGSGRPYQYRQYLPSGHYAEFSAEDVVHFTFDKKEGFLFGTPTLVPVLDDIRALRAIEQNIELLIYKFLFPLFQYVVGNKERPAGITEDGRSEIEVARQELQNMPTEGCIVTPEHHEIRAIGSESKALRAESYLEHFKSRVLAGLGVSSVDMGQPETSNKSTADNLSRALIDDIKDYQDAFESQFNAFVVNELLLEATFVDEILTPEHKVELFFREIDIDKQIKVETHMADIFAKDGITWDEYRAELGRDPIEIPEDPADQDPTKYPQWHRTAWKLFREPAAIISSGDESYSSFAVAGAQNRAVSLTPEDLEGQQQAELEAEKQKIKAKPVPKPAAKKKDNFLSSDYEEMFGAVAYELTSSGKMDYIKSKIIMVAERMEAKLNTAMNSAFINGMGTTYSYKYPYKVKAVRKDISSRVSVLIKRLSMDLLSAIRKRVDTDNPNDRIFTLRVVFDALKYRVDFITNSEITRAHNLGKIYRAILDGSRTSKIVTGTDSCDTCKEYGKQILSLESFTIHNAPPHHPNCKCALGIID